MMHHGDATLALRRHSFLIGKHKSGKVNACSREFLHTLVAKAKPRKERPPKLVPSSFQSILRQVFHGFDFRFDFPVCVS